MALTSSKKLALKSPAPDFKLQDMATGQWVSLKELPLVKATVIMFICNHCPYVKHIQKELVKIANRYQLKGVCFIAISSNDPDLYPEDSPSHMKEISELLQYPFPYLFDETQEVAKAFHAECTPEFFVFNEKLKLSYHGRFDDSTPGNSTPVTGKELSDALDGILQGKSPSFDQKPSIGCSIKWKT